MEIDTDIDLACLTKFGKDVNISTRNKCHQYFRANSVEEAENWIRQNTTKSDFVDMYKTLLKFYCGYDRCFHKNVFQYLIENATFDLGFENNILIKLAVNENLYHAVEILIENGVKIDFEDNILVKIASHRNDFDALRVLVENGADIHADREYALKAAITNSNTKCIKYLIDSGADVCIDNSICIYIAADYADTSILLYLLEKNQATDLNWNRIACKIIETCDISLIKKFAHHIDFSIVELDQEIISDLINDASSELIKFLIDCGVNFASVNCVKKSTDIDLVRKVDLLINQGVDIHAIISILHSDQSEKN